MFPAAGHAVTAQQVAITHHANDAFATNITFATNTGSPASIVFADDARLHHRAGHHHGKRHHHRHRAVLPQDYAAWSKVAVCEEGGWHTAGGEYPDSIGINITNYEAFGGTPQPAGTPTLKQRAEQIQVADRLVRRYGIAIPDQGGCDGGW